MTRAHELYERLRMLLLPYFEREREIALLTNAIEQANEAGEFENSVDLATSLLDRERVQAIVEQQVWELLRVDFFGGSNA